jgi:hypothetical protein
MYTITINLTDGTKIGPRQLDTTLESSELKDELEENPEIGAKFLTAFVELPAIESRDLVGHTLSKGEIVNLSTYQQVVEFLGRSNG